MSICIAINSMATGKLPQGDPRWAAFNDSFVNKDIEPIEIANFIYMGHAYTTWQHGRRSTANFICGQHIAIDMDTGDERSAVKTLEANPWVAMYGGLIHTTPSHTNDAPRARVLFFLDEPITEAGAYQTATTFVMSQFDGCDSVCKDASRFFYGAKGCEISFGGNVFPIRHLRRFYKQWRQTNRDAPSRSTVERPRPEPAATFTRVERNEGDKMGEVQAALARVDPWALEYQRWVAILGAMHDAFGDAGLSVAEQWAQGRDGEVRRMWRSFGKFSGRRATLASLFQLVRH